MTDPLAPILNSTAFKLHQATLLIDRSADTYLRREHDLGYAHFLVLLIVRVAGPTSQRSIAENLGVSRASITQRVTALTRDGLLVVTPDPDDSRAHLVDLTDGGCDRVDRAWKGLDAHDDGLDAGVDDAALATQLDIIIANGRRASAS